MSKTIEKKILPEYFSRVVKEEKTFELRKDDTYYEVGDALSLREWDGEKYTGNVVTRLITYILRDCPERGLMPGYCILGLQPVFEWYEKHGDLIKDDGSPRVLSPIELSQLAQQKEPCVWLEVQEITNRYWFEGWAEPALSDETGIDLYPFGNEVPVEAKYRDYGSAYRCWSGRPTESQMAMKAWRA